MGLDMYLQAKRFLWSEERAKIKISGIKIPEGLKAELIEVTQDTVRILPEIERLRAINMRREWLRRQRKRDRRASERIYQRIYRFKFVRRLHTTNITIGEHFIIRFDYKIVNEEFQEIMTWFYDNRYTTRLKRDD